MKWIASTLGLLLLMSGTAQAQRGPRTEALERSSVRDRERTAGEATFDLLRLAVDEQEEGLEVRLTLRHGFDELLCRGEGDFAAIGFQQFGGRGAPGHLLHLLYLPQQDEPIGSTMWSSATYGRARLRNVAHIDSGLVAYGTRRASYNTLERDPTRWRVEGDQVVVVVPWRLIPFDRRGRVLVDATLNEDRVTAMRGDTAEQLLARYPDGFSFPDDSALSVEDGQILYEGAVFDGPLDDLPGLCEGTTRSLYDGAPAQGEALLVTRPSD